MSNSEQKELHIRKILDANEREQKIKKMAVYTRTVVIDIRPNDKCQCGSGKKAKKCCGCGKIHDVRKPIKKRK